MAGIGVDLRAAYDKQYSDGGLQEWRELGGKYKAKNIIDVCRGYRFGTVLECGAGEGSILKFLDVAGAFEHLHAIEISESGIAAIQKRRLSHLQEVRKFDGYRIPYPDASFDMVYCSHVIEHVEHPRLLLRELKRVAGFQVFEIPLDYSVGVDKEIGYFLSYGHINVYTPSLFRFLLKSEGFDILAGKLSRSTPEVILYNWYHNQGLKPTLTREFRLRVQPLVRAAKRVLLGKATYEERCYSAYTCLTRSTGGLRVL
jgi:ubiquinone/menaquinone biosynthesis C-methylase UbiE